MPLQENKEQIGTAIGRIPSGCAILTVDHNEQSTGMLVSWYQQTSFEPPTLTVAIKPGRPAQTLMDGSGRFLLNIISDDPSSMFKHFGKGFSLEEDAFAGLEFESSPYGPILSACIAHIGCRIIEKFTAGDHELYVVQVEAGQSAENAKPYVHLRKSGFSY